MAQYETIWDVLEGSQFYIANMGYSKCLDSGFPDDYFGHRVDLYECIPKWQLANYNQVWWIAFFGDPFPPNPVGVANFQIQEWNYRQWCLESSADMGILIQKCDYTVTKQTWRMIRNTGKLDSIGHEIVYIINDPPPFKKLTGSGPTKKTKHAQVERK